MIDGDTLMSSSQRQTADDFIAHHGRRGMRWGQHIFGKDKTSGGTRLKRKDLKKYISDYNRLHPKSKIKLDKKTVIQVGKKKYDNKGRLIDENVSVLNDKKNPDVSTGTSLKQMSTEDLIAATNRMRAEKAYKDAFNDLNPAPKASRGEQFVKSLGESILKSGVENFVGKAVQGFSDKVADKAVAAATRKIFGVKNTDLNKTPEELAKMEDEAVQDVKNKISNIAAIRVTQEAMKEQGVFTDKESGKFNAYAQAQAAYSPYKKQK